MMAPRRLGLLGQLSGAVYSANPVLAPLPVLVRREVESCNTLTTGGFSLDNALVESALRESAVSFHPLSYLAPPRLLLP
jgi:hypothetical protein